MGGPELVDDDVALAHEPLVTLLVSDLEPNTTYWVSNSGIVRRAGDAQAYRLLRFKRLINGTYVRTLRAPTGPMLCSFATVNDVHFGDTKLGAFSLPFLGRSVLLRRRDDEEPFPVMASRVALEEMQQLRNGQGPEVIIVKGDLTAEGTLREYEQFRQVYDEAVGDRLLDVRGNHDSRSLRIGADQPFGATHVQHRTVPGAEIVVLDTAVVDRMFGEVSEQQLRELETIAQSTSQPVLVFGHHPVGHVVAKRWNEPTTFRLVYEPDSVGERVFHQLIERYFDTREKRILSPRFLRATYHVPVRVFDKKVLKPYFAISPTSSQALLEVIERNPQIVGYFAGHTHRNRHRLIGDVDTFPTSQDVKCVPLVEVASPNEFPGAWAEYRVYSDGIMQIGHRLRDPEAHMWMERSRWTQKGFMQVFAQRDVRESCFWIETRSTQRDL